MMSILDAWPKIIQGGMGVGVSSWPLAKAVASEGQIGVISGTGLDGVMARRLQVGDPGGHIRRALDSFPWPDMVKGVLEKYFIPNSKADDQPFKPMTRHDYPLCRETEELLIIANYVETYLAKEGHNGLVGINFLDKIQVPNMAGLFGAMLAGVDLVIMGGGLPLAIPAILDGLARNEPVEMPLYVEDNPDKNHFVMRFDPSTFGDGTPRKLARPKFIAVVSSTIAAKTMIRRASGEVNGFVVENYTAGGHNAPPRSAGAAEEYTAKDIPDLAQIKALDRPFWLAGGFSSTKTLNEAVATGACGVQVGTIFSLCEESGILPHLKQEVLRQALAGTLVVRTDFRASPTGYPFKIACLDNTLSNKTHHENRKRLCDLGALRQIYLKPDGSLGQRCPSEPVDQYVRKGGEIERTVGKHCLCNSLVATIGLGQVGTKVNELPLVTMGEDFGFVPKLVTPGQLHYTAKDAINLILGEA